MIIDKNEILNCYTREVKKFWEQSCKNNIESDHRIKNITVDNIQIYSWIVNSKNDFTIPNFSKL